MRYRFFRKWRIAGLSSLFLFGCESSSNRHSYPDDPLLLDKKPVESKVENAAPPNLAQAEPTPPPMPLTAVASAVDHPTTNLTGVDKQRPGVLTAQAARSAGKGLVPATPASRSRDRREVEPGPPMRRLVPETYGHASDYSWLQGVLSKPPQGPAILRYHETPTDDKWRGQVALGSDPHLAPFDDGDLVLVEGELLADPSDGPYPRFRIRAMWLVRRDH
jgi:hypothetical protein